MGRIVHSSGQNSGNIPWFDRLATVLDVLEGHENDCRTSGVMEQDVARPSDRYEPEGKSEGCPHYCRADALPCVFEDKTTRDIEKQATI